MASNEELERDIRLLRKDVEQLYKLSTTVEMQEMRQRGAGIFEPDEAVSDASRLEPAPRHFHQEVLDKLMQLIQETTGVQVTERNAVALLESMIADANDLAKKLKEQPKAVEGVYAAINIADVLQVKLDKVMEIFRAHYFEEIHEYLARCIGELKAIDELPDCISSLTHSIEELKDNMRKS